MSAAKNVLRQHIGYWLNRLRQKVHIGFEGRLAKYDVSIAMWRILICVYDGSAQSVNSLAKYTEIDKASISRVVGKLVKKGLLSHDPGMDLRSGIITITDQGKALVPHLINAVKENEQYFFGKLDEKEKATLLHLLQKLVVGGISTKE